MQINIYFESNIISQLNAELVFFLQQNFAVSFELCLLLSYCTYPTASELEIKVVFSQKHLY